MDAKNQSSRKANYIMRLKNWGNGSAPNRIIKQWGKLEGRKGSFICGVTFGIQGGEVGAYITDGQGKERRDLAKTTEGGAVKLA
jgi:hypothetical protein